MATIISTQGAGISAVDVATRQHNRIFLMYMVVLGLGVLIGYFVWTSGNRVQDAIRADAAARIAEATKLGNQANERANKLEQENLILRTDLNTESGKVAGLQKAAFDAKAAQQRVEMDLATQQTRAANAENELLKIQERMRPSLTAVQRSQLLTALKSGPTGKITIQAVLNDSGAMYLARLLAEILKEAGWEAAEPGFNAATVYGAHMIIQVRDAQHASAQAVHLVKSLRSIGLSVEPESKGEMVQDDIVLLIGAKP